MSRPKYKIQPWPHQLEAIERARDVDHFALLFEQGCGKTSTMVNILREKFAREKKTLRTLILCPPIVVENWRREILAHSYIDEKLIYTLTGSSFIRLCTMDNARHQDCILITNYEALLMKRLVEVVGGWRPDVMILDESHKIKSPSTQRTKQVLKLSQNVKYRFILTGTPILNSAFDIFSQFLFLDGGETFSTNHRRFRDDWFFDRNAKRITTNSYFPDWQIKPGAMKLINKKIYKKAMRVTKDECLQLPPLVRQSVFVDLGDKQKKIYQNMENDFITELSNGAVATGELAITKTAKLKQIANGFIGDDDNTIHTFDPNPKAKALEELLETICVDHKVIVWCIFKQNYEDIRRVCKKLDLPYVEVHGGVSTKKKQENVDTFTHNPAVRVLIGHPGSAGIGVNLVAASYAIFYSQDFNLENDQQARARNHRGGSEIHEKITHIDIVATGTIDELILAALDLKLKTASEILNHIRGAYVNRSNQGGKGIPVGEHGCSANGMGGGGDFGIRHQHPAIDADARAVGQGKEETSSDR